MLQNELNALWLQIPNNIVTNLVESMPKRVRACMKAKGGHIKY